MRVREVWEFVVTYLSVFVYSLDALLILLRHTQLDVISVSIHKVKQRHNKKTEAKKQSLIVNTSSSEVSLPASCETLGVEFSAVAQSLRYLYQDDPVSGLLPALVCVNFFAEGIAVQASLSLSRKL
jgi:hypothetical protein